MQTIRKSVFAFLAALSFSSSTFAQEGDPPILEMTYHLDRCLVALETVERLSEREHRGNMRPCGELSSTWHKYVSFGEQRRNPTPPLGTGLGFKGVSTCLLVARHLADEASLGRLIEHLVSEWLEIMGHFEEGDWHYFHHDVSAFVKEMNKAASLPPSNQVEFLKSSWNSVCAGSFGIPRNAVVAADKELSSVSKSAGSIIATGKINESMLQSIIELVETDNIGNLKQIQLRSVGGNDIELAMKLGRFIRSNDLWTTAVGNCESACVLAFVGGTLRRLGTGPSSGDITYGRLGFHRLTFGDPTSNLLLPIPDGSNVYRDVEEYLKEMTIVPTRVIEFMTKENGLNFYYPNVDELCDADVIGSDNHLPRSLRQQTLQSNCRTFGFMRTWGFSLNWQPPAVKEK